MMIRKVSFGILVCAAIASIAQARAEDGAKCFVENDAELPSGSPSKAKEGTPPQYASWLGVFQGYMDMSSSASGGGAWCKKLLVESVDTDGTWEGTYSAGSWANISSYQTNIRRESIAEDGTLTYSLGSGVVFEYRLSADGTEATGTAYGSRGNYPAKLERVR